MSNVIRNRRCTLQVDSIGGKFHTTSSFCKRSSSIVNHTKPSMPDLETCMKVLNLQPEISYQTFASANINLWVIIQLKYSLSLQHKDLLILSTYSYCQALSRVKNDGTWHLPRRIPGTSCTRGLLSVISHFPAGEPHRFPLDRAVPPTQVNPPQTNTTTLPITKEESLR